MKPSRFFLRVLIFLPLISIQTSDGIPTPFVFDAARFTRSNIAGQYQDSFSDLHHSESLSLRPDGGGSVGPRSFTSFSGFDSSPADSTNPEDTDTVSWLRRHSTTVGNASDYDIKVILNSIKQMQRLESPKFPKVKVYNYDFGNNNVKELLVYMDPDEEKRWVINIEDIDMRQNLIVFPLGDLGFGFRKEDTLVVLRKSKSKIDPFHYIHLAYLVSKSKKGKHLKEVQLEWDSIKPQDLVPIPISYGEGKEEHASHCNPRECGLQEVIFGTCTILRLTCSVLSKLPITGQDKERMDALIREKQPFIYELARIFTINKRYLKEEEPVKRTSTSNRAKRTESLNGYTGERYHHGHISDGEELHHSVKKDHVAASVNAFPVEGSETEGNGKVEEKKKRQAIADPEIEPDGGDLTPIPIDERKPAPAGRIYKIESERKGTDRDISAPDLKPEQENSTLEEAARAAPTSREQKSSDLEEKEKQKLVQNKYAITHTYTYPNVNDNRPTLVAMDEKSQSKPSGKSLSPEEQLPSSFDLLMMKNESFPSIGSAPEYDQPVEYLAKLPKPKPLSKGNDTYFARIIEKIRTSPPSKYTVRPMECIGCEKFGTFLNDYDDSILITFVANNIIADIFKNSSSKRNLFHQEIYDILGRHSDIPFIGYGSCDYDLTVLNKAPLSGEIDDLVHYYAESLASNCNELKKNCETQRIKHKLREMLTSRYHLLEVWPDMSIRFNKSSIVPERLILSSEEFREFMNALILSAYTTEYRMYAAHYRDRHYNDPNVANRHQSERMKFKTRLILRMIDDLVKEYPQHLIKGLRHILQILQDSYLSLVAEYIGILDYSFRGGEDDQTFYKTTNRNDRLQVIALKDFIINGVAPLIRSGAGSFPAFITYFNRNFKRILHSFVEFGIERPPVIKGGHQVRSVEDKELDKVFAKMAEGIHFESETEMDAEEDGERKPVIRKRFVKITRY